MKIRTGFVSNSSSSSFIVGIARIKDWKKFHNFTMKNNIKLNHYSCKVISVNDENINNIVSKTNNQITVHSFKESVNIPLTHLNDADKLFIVNITNDEGDDYFDTTGNGDMDYDVDMDNFDEYQQLLYSMFDNEESGLDIKTSDVRYGAGRNG